MTIVNLTFLNKKNVDCNKNIFFGCFTLIILIIIYKTNKKDIRILGKKCVKNNNGNRKLILIKKKINFANTLIIIKFCIDENDNFLTMTLTEINIEKIIKLLLVLNH